VVLEDSPSRGLLVQVGKDSARALHNLTCLAFVVELAQSAPLAEVHLGWDRDQVDVVLSADGLHQLGVGFFVAVLSKAAQLCTTGVQSTDSLVQSATESVNLDGVLDNNLQSIHRVGDFFDDLFDDSILWGFNSHFLMHDREGERLTSGTGYYSIETRYTGNTDKTKTGQKKIEEGQWE
jgi:hypothetical protein